MSKKTPNEGGFWRVVVMSDSDDDPQEVTLVECRPSGHPIRVISRHGVLDWRHPERDSEAEAAGEASGLRKWVRGVR